MFFKKPVCFLLMCFVSLNAFNQNTGSIKGKVSDNTSALEFVTVSLFSTADSSKVLQNTHTDSAGSFVLDAIASGKYFLKIQLIGYQPEQINIVLNSQNKIFDAGNISLIIDSKQLQSVTVMSQKNILQKTFVINLMYNNDIDL